MSYMPLVDEMNASFQRERGKGIHHISKSILFATIESYRFVFSISKSIRKIYLLSVTLSVQVNKYRYIIINEKEV